MTRFGEYLSSQFMNPRGFIGNVITFSQNIINVKMYKSTVAVVNATAEDSILDIGYGNGHLLKYLYKKTGSSLYGIDISDTAKALAKKRNKKALRDGKLNLEVGSCVDLPYEDDTFSAVTSINTIYFWEDTVKGLKEIRRVLKEGQSFYNVVYTKKYLDKIKYTEVNYKKFETEELVRLGKKAGFSKVSVKNIVDGDSVIVRYTK